MVGQIKKGALIKLFVCVRLEKRKEVAKTLLVLFDSKLLVGILQMRLGALFFLLED